MLEAFLFGTICFLLGIMFGDYEARKTKKRAVEQSPPQAFSPN